MIKLIVILLLGISIGTLCNALYYENKEKKMNTFLILLLGAIIGYLLGSIVAVHHIVRHVDTGKSIFETKDKVKIYATKIRSKSNDNI